MFMPLSKTPPRSPQTQVSTNGTYSPDGSKPRMDYLRTDFTGQRSVSEGRSAGGGKGAKGAKGEKRVGSCLSCVVCSVWSALHVGKIEYEASKFPVAGVKS